MEEIIVKKENYQIIESLNSYTYVVKKDDDTFLAYHFEDNKESFQNFKFATKRLKNFGIAIPKVYKIDKKAQIFIVEYLQGDTCFEDIQKGDISEKVFEQLFMMNYKARVNRLRLDFHPSNFIFKDGTLYYLPFTFTQYFRDQDFTEKELKLWFYTNELVDELKKKGLPLQKDRIKSEFVTNKEMVLTVVKYFR